MAENKEGAERGPAEPDLTEFEAANDELVPLTNEELHATLYDLYSQIGELAHILGKTIGIVADNAMQPATMAEQLRELLSVE